MLPPFDFGAAFMESAHINERKSSKTQVWIADRTPLSATAGRLLARELDRAGFQLGAYVRLPDAPGLSLHDVWWPSRCRATAAELVDLARRVAEIPAEEERARARQAAAVAEANAERAARGRAGAERLAGIVQSSPWMLGRLAGEAASLLGSELTDSSALRIVELLATADRAVANAEARLRRLAPRDWRALAADPDVRIAALEGCVFLSERDADRATKRNDAGWGADDTGVGHVLAGREALSVGEAAHALALLHHHRRQLPPDLLARMAGGAPALQPALL